MPNLPVLIFLCVSLHSASKELEQILFKSCLKQVTVNYILFKIETANILLDSAKSVLLSITFSKSKKLKAKTYFLY